MSDQEQIKEEWYDKNGRKFHRDSYGEWFINGKGYENIYMNQITNQDFKEQVETIIENTEEDRYNFDYEGVPHTIWIKHDDPKQSSVSRKEKANSSTAERVYDNIQTGKPQGQNKPQPQNTSNYQQNKQWGDKPKKAIWLDKDFVTKEEFVNRKASNKYIDIMPATEMSPNNYMIKDESGVTKMWVWIGRREYNW